MNHLHQSLWLEALEKSGSAIGKVEGNSMLPGFPAGTTVRLERKGNLRSGDVVVFRRGERLVIHRLYHPFRLGLELYWTEKGDGSTRIRVVMAEKILGRAVAVVAEGHTELPLPWPSSGSLLVGHIGSFGALVDIMTRRWREMQNEVMRLKE